MKPEKLFMTLSYAAVFCGFLSMWVSGTFGIVGTGLFIAIMLGSWFLEGTRWQLSERLGTVLIVAALPAYYAAWRYGFIQFADSGALVAGLLGRLILSLSAIKMLQRKSDRDWIFLYLMAFFEVLLGAGLSISALYLASFVLYVFVMVWTIIVFEIRKAGRTTKAKMSPEGLLPSAYEPESLPSGRLPAAAAGLIVFIIILAVPLFFMLPRVGGAGLGGNQGGVSAQSGFSDKVTLGGIGNIQQNDEVVMRVRIEGQNGSTSGMKWRGVALDNFDNKSWSRKATPREPRMKGDREIIDIDNATDREGLTVQTVYLEPLDAPVLFALSRIVRVQGNFPVLFKDKYGSVSFNRVGERISYKVLSDRTIPTAAELRADRTPYPDGIENYLQLPQDLDGRIVQLTEEITANSRSRYDTARTVEEYLQNNFGYTLEQKASGSQPLGDFLFNVREGHCEYFATALAVMLRTKGIATRIVNGFSEGEYNETADVWVVKQRNAHSWVEVYFPGENVWVPFDPTPFSGRSSGTGNSGITAKFGKYLEALETFWIQYFVAFDNQEQRSLFRSVRSGFQEYQAKSSTWLNDYQERLNEWWKEVRGDKGFEQSAKAVGYGFAYLIGAVLGIILLIWLYRRIIKLTIWQRIFAWLKQKNEASIIEFYERMQRVLASKGFMRQPYQTPLEFAFALNMPEAIR